MRNKYPGTCYRCGLHCKVGDGYFERHQGKWRVQHVSCAMKHNKRSGTCYRCGLYCVAGDGYAEHRHGKWRVQHATCAAKAREANKQKAQQGELFPENKQFSSPEGRDRMGSAQPGGPSPCLKIAKSP